MIDDVALLDLIDNAMYRRGPMHGFVSVDAVARTLIRMRPELADMGRDLDDLIAASAVSYHLAVDFDRLS